jgi:hypothetical protein
MDRILTPDAVVFVESVPLGATAKVLNAVSFDYQPKNRRPRPARPTPKETE